MDLFGSGALGDVEVSFKRPITTNRVKAEYIICLLCSVGFYWPVQVNQGLPVFCPQCGKHHGKAA